MQLLSKPEITTVVTVAKSDLGQYQNKPKDSAHSDLNFEIRKSGVGYVYNGAWYFKVIEFSPPYMKIEVQHPMGNFPVEFFDVVKI